MLPLSAVGRSAVSVTAVAKLRTCCLAAAPWQPLPVGVQLLAHGSAGPELLWVQTGSSHFLLAPCFTLLKYCLMREEKKPKTVFLFVCVSIVMPYPDLHLSQQILRNFSSVHVRSGTEKTWGNKSWAVILCIFTWLRMWMKEEEMNIQCTWITWLSPLLLRVELVASW